MSDEPKQIAAWVCDQCLYWRQEQSSGVHTAPDPSDQNGPYVKHPLRLAYFVESAYSARVIKPKRGGRRQ